MNNRMERTYRRSLGRFPTAWQRLHSEIVLGMLLDDAESRGLKRVPARQRLSLRIQGMAEHSTLKRVRILAAAATALWLLGLLLGSFPNINLSPNLDSTNLSPAAMASLEAARSFVSFALPYVLTVMALTGFLYRVGWLAALPRLVLNLVCGIGVALGTIGSWMIMNDHLATVFEPQATPDTYAGILNVVALAGIIAVPLLLLVSLALHAFSTRSGRAPVIWVAVLLLVVFAALVLGGSALIQALAPGLYLASWMQEKSPLHWLGTTPGVRDASRPHLIEWTRG